MRKAIASFANSFVVGYLKMIQKHIAESNRLNVEELSLLSKSFDAVVFCLELFGKEFY